MTESTPGRSHIPVQSARCVFPVNRISTLMREFTRE
ncbi:unnamed protein product [Staurois parvus]|uniref:Uncharacterized protein n=1 Tax=Staurois parvus TaxID=386267 RepID=A0ABN9GMM9_9NEOB|nr:unnamed protein product [Staurois parvus]